MYSINGLFPVSAATPPWPAWWEGVPGCQLHNSSGWYQLLGKEGNRVELGCISLPLEQDGLDSHFRNVHLHHKRLWDPIDVKVVNNSLALSDQRRLRGMSWRSVVRGALSVFTKSLLKLAKPSSSGVAIPAPLAFYAHPCTHPMGREHTLGKRQ